MLIYLFILGQDLLNWPILQFARVVSPIKYRDTYWVLADADCYKEIGSRIYGLESETGCPGYLYGLPLLRFLNLVKVEASDTEIFVYVMRALFSLTLALVSLELAKKTSLTFFLLSLVVISPGTQLMLYNGNFDLLIFVIVIIGYFSIKNNFVFIGLLFFFISGIFKFYTIPLLLLMFFCLPRFKHKVTSLVLLLISSLSAISDLMLMQVPIPSSGYAQFGLTIYTKYLDEMGLLPPPLIGFLLSFVIFIVSVLIVTIFSKRVGQKRLGGDPNDQILFLVLTTVFLACYFAGLSYDPRLIYLTLAGFYLATQIPTGWYRFFLYIILISSSLMSTGLELGFISRGHVGFHPLRVLQLLNDLSISLMTAALFVQLLMTIPRNRIISFLSRIEMPRTRNSQNL
jgi:hypothetical protein